MMAQWTLFIIILISVLSSITVVKSSPEESQLISDLLKDYDKRERPVANSSDSLQVQFQLILRNIIDVDESGQSMTTLVWAYYRWSDYKLQWDPSMYGDVDSIRIPADDLWVPDIHLYNSVQPNMVGELNKDAVISSNGAVELVVPRTLTTTCQMDLTWFPYDRQSCTMKFGSWVYNGLRLDLSLPDGQKSVGLDGYTPNVEWLIVDVPAQRNVIIYDCCPEDPYIDLTFTINMERRKLYYDMNVILPSSVLTVLTMVMFTIPPEAYERLTFGGILFLGTMLFIQHVGSTIPASSVSVPAIAVYLNFILILNVIALALSGLVLNISHMACSEPKWVHGGLGRILGMICCVTRPDEDEKLASGRRSGAGWRFVAAVVNRLLFILLVITAVIGSIVLLTKRPAY